ncbi:D-alanyl-D-alanine carboxypeptidase [Streptomyces sp. NPDC001406]|uniref:D-alanyl-D-alanine carboxypeptidase n=1 Tax=Streptomyces sp. NPDC001406 TaxID=3364572 RepID=UPI0036C59238
MEEASVAGESPDKSKQRESSAEPTPGSGGPVPEARDPRLAVSRRTADTATRVLSVRDVPATAGGPEQEAEDSRLRAAVATWVRTGGSAGADEETQANSEGEGARSASQADSGPEDARSAARADSEAKGKAAAGSETEDERHADSDGEDEQGAAQSGSEATDGVGSAADAKGEGESAADTEAKGEGRSATVETEHDEAAGRGDSESEDARGAAQADSEAKASETAAGSETDDETHADSDGEDDHGAAQRQTDSEPEDARSTAQADSEAKASETAAGSETDDEAHTDSDGEDDHGAAQRQTDSEPEDARSTARADSETKAREAAAGSKTEDDEAAAQADSEPEDARSAAQADAEDGEAPEAGGGGDVDEPAADAEPASASKVDADAKGSAPKSTPDPRTPRDPRAADGGDAPQGPPAPKDESRTGGAGGNGTAEGEAEAEDAKPTDAPKPPVDHPTAVFKAPRPKPQVDQPTTMLKLGGTPKPKPSEPAEAERTSKFVALKPLDDPATRTPKPPAQAPAPAPADVTTAIPQVGPERTTQQPLPPKPPLDLLAELTNTPPPPETPVRTIVRRVKIWTPLVVLLVIIFAVVQAMRPLPTPTLALTAEESYQFEGGKVTLPWPSEGQGWMDVDGIGTMDSFGKQTPVAIGSVAKTMTAYIVLKDHPLKAGEEGPTITVDATAEKEGGYDKTGESTLNSIKAGDKLTLKQALSAVMIPSANNIARLLARWDAGGSEAAFVKKMNATAKELGMTATTYTDPSGLKETTVSTAGDQVKLGNAVVKVPALVAITSAASWKDPSGHNWPNYNQLPYLVGAIGIKTGSTTAAGGNLLFAARKKVGGETVTVVGAILGQHKPSILDTVNAVSKTALLAAEDALTSAKTVKKGDVVGYVDDGLDGHTPVVVTEDVTAVGWAGLKVKLSFASDTVPHTAKAGTKVGTLTVGDGKSGAVQVPVALQKDLTEPGFGSKLTRLG